MERKSWNDRTRFLFPRFKPTIGKEGLLLAFLTLVSSLSDRIRRMFFVISLRWSSKLRHSTMTFKQRCVMGNFVTSWRSKRNLNYFSKKYHQAGTVLHLLFFLLVRSLLDSSLMKTLRMARSCNQVKPFAKLGFFSTMAHCRGTVKMFNWSI